VLLAVDFQSIGVVGAKGLVVAWVETVCLVLFVHLVIGKLLLKMDAAESMLVACGLSICGASAIISLLGVVNVKQDSKFVIALLAFLSIMNIPIIPLIPIIGSHIGLNVEVKEW
jgi:uncharacterized membrane protein YadS